MDARLNLKFYDPNLCSTSSILDDPKLTPTIVILEFLNGVEQVLGLCVFDLSVCLRHPVQFFLGLLLALR